MKEHFFFGYLYIKSSRALAVISVVIGLAVCGSLLFDWRKTVDEKRYKSNPALISSLQRLMSEYDNTKKQALELHRQLMVASQKKIELIDDPSFYDTYTLADEFADLQAQVDNIQKNSDILKNLVFESFEDSIDYLLKKMNKHAIDKGWLNQGDVKAAVAHGGTIPLFKVVDFRELKVRKDSLNEGLMFLNELLRIAEKEDSKNNLSALSNHLSAYLKILNSININVPLPENDVDGIDETQKKKVFVVIDRLRFMKEAVRDVVFKSWSLDAQYEKTSQMIQQELGMCLDAKEDVRQTISKFSFDLVWTVLISVVVTISILLSSDLLKAVFLLSLRRDPKS